MNNLDFGMIGNCTINALVDPSARIVWSCFPRFDGDPVFCNLLDDGGDQGFFAVEIEDMAAHEQSYLDKTAILKTVLRDSHGGAIEVIDFCPRFQQFDRMFRPTMIVRLVRPLGGAPRVTVRVRPRTDYGATTPEFTRGSNHIRYVHDGNTLRLNTDAPITYVLEERPFQLDQPIVLILGPDESLRSGLPSTAREFFEQTLTYWRNLSGRLHLPFEWQDAVIRSAITLKLCSFEETGAIIAAPTTSMPEAQDEGRNWDYRYCWIRDAFFVVRTLNRLGYVQTMEDYLGYITNLIARADDGYMQPVFGIGLERKLIEREIDSLAGYLGNKPVRVGNQAYEHLQHDGYGSVILAATQAFFDSRLSRPAGRQVFERLELLGEKAWEYHDQPDAGLWEFRHKARVHTHSSFMCWAACDRLARIAKQLRLDDREHYWRERADHIKGVIEARAWNEEMGTYTASFDGDDLDASLLLMNDVGFLDSNDPRFTKTVNAIGRELKEGGLREGPFVFRYRTADDFGAPEHAFLICSFWYVEALGAIGRHDEARSIFGDLLKCRNAQGLFAEHVDRRTNILWGNVPQTYSHVGLISCAMQLSVPWEQVV